MNGSIELKRKINRYFYCGPQSHKLGDRSVTAWQRLVARQKCLAGGCLVSLGDTGRTEVSSFQVL